ncbi:hypothetical protein MBANPS3_003758 [Mucor bainieri]
MSIYPEFLYSQGDPTNVKYGKIVLVHHKMHPVEKQFYHVENAIQKLYDTYKKEGERTREDRDIYLATKAFLHQQCTDIMFNCETNGDLLKSQFAIVVPTEFKKDEKFIEKVLRPLFIEAGFGLKADRKCKLLFFSVLEAVLFAQQQYSTLLWPEGSIMAINREKKYLSCMIQIHYNNSISLQLDKVHMKYDKHFIAASESSISSSENQLLAPHFEPFSSKTIRIPNCASRTTLELPRFILSRVFADSAHKISFEYGDLFAFYLNGEYMAADYMEDFLKSLLSLIEKQIEKDPDLSQSIDIDICQDFGIWDYLNQDEKDNFASLTYKEILDFLPQIDMPFVLHEIQSFAKKHDCTPRSADEILLTVNNDFLRRRNESSKMQGIFARCQQTRLSKAIHNLTRDDEFFDFDFTTSFAVCKGVLFKILTIIELSNKLQEPILLSSNPKCGGPKSEVWSDGANELKIIKGIPEYQFYVEAKITFDHRIKLYLHQVIATHNGEEKSTLPIANTVIELDDMYNVICNKVWSASQEHSSFNCTSTSQDTYDHYQSFRAKFSTFLDEAFDQEVPADEDIHDLNEIHIGNLECSCRVQVSHYMILTMGVKHYLNEIAESITGCLKSLAMFGKFKVQSIIATGSLLSAWMKLQNTLYREFIWRELKVELYASLYQHRMKAHLILSEDVVALFTDENLIKLEKYQQVVGEKRVLVDIERAEIPAKLYEDKGDRFELVPSIEVDGEEHWRYLLTPEDITPIDQTGISKRFFIIPDRLEEESDSEDFDEDYPSQYYRIGIYVCYPENRQQISHSCISLKEEALVIQSSLTIGSTGQTFKDGILSTDFPLVFTQKPQNYDFKSRCSLDSNYFHTDIALLPERMTLK